MLKKAFFKTCTIAYNTSENVKKKKPEKNENTQSQNVKWCQHHITSTDLMNLSFALLQ